DVLWEAHRAVGATEPIWVICGYRSPATNAMLRRRSGGVAQFSTPMLGKAIDFYIPGVPLEQLREAGLRAERGGVGFYPSSNFVHLDTGNVRHWPRMPEAQLARVMAKGPLTQVASRDRPIQTARIPTPLESLARLVGAGATGDGSNHGGVWRGVPEIEAPSTRSIDTRRSSADPIATGSAAPWPLPERLAGSTALAYAPTTGPVPPVRTASLNPVNV